MEITPVPHSSSALSRGRVIGALLVLAPVIALVFLPSILGVHRYVVPDDAMAGDRDGSIGPGSVALTRQVPATDLEVGDVITFRPPVADGVDPGASVTRRIVAIDKGVAITRGDGRDDVDPWRLDVSQDTYPRVVASVPWIGYPFAGHAGQGGWLVLAIASVVALLAAAVVPWRRRHERRTGGQKVTHAYG